MSQLFTPKFVDMVRVTSTTTGTGPLVCGQAVPGFASFADSVSVGDSFYYSVQGVDKVQEREVGRGTLLPGGTIDRQPVSGGLTNFTPGPKTIALVAAAEWYAAIQDALGASSGGNVSVSRAALKEAPPGGARFLAESAREGMFVWDAAVPVATHQADQTEGIYVARVATAAGAWVRKYDGAVNVRWFGATGDGVTNDSAAFVGAIAFLRRHGKFEGGNKLIVPAGDYFLGNTTLDITHALVMEGAGSGMVGGVGTRLLWSGGCVGIRLQYTITAGDRQIVAPHSSAAGSIFRGLHLNGGGTAGAANHAFDLMARGAFTDCQAYNWGGNGFNIVASAGGGVGLEGNANCFSVISCSAYGCKNGMYLAGADANAGVVVGGDYSQNREWGIRDDSFLGNTYSGVHTAGNVAGCYKTTPLAAACVFNGCYAEGDQPAPSFANTTIVVGGTWGAGTPGGVFTYGTTNGEVVSVSPNGQLRVVGPDGYNNTSLALPRQTSSLFFGGTAYDNCKLQLYSDATSNGGYTVRAGFKHSFQVAFTESMAVDGTGMSLASGKVLKVDGLQVLASRRTGWTAAIGTPNRGAFAAAAAGTASAAYVQSEAQDGRNRIAALEARLIGLEGDCRAHGLIN